MHLDLFGLTLLEQLVAVFVCFAPGAALHFDPIATDGAVGSGDTVLRDVDQAPADLRVMRALFSECHTRALRAKLM
jgi:hypothetical protein